MLFWNFEWTSEYLLENKSSSSGFCVFISGFLLLGSNASVMWQLILLNSIQNQSPKEQFYFEQNYFSHIERILFLIKAAELAVPTLLVWLVLEPHLVQPPLSTSTHSLLSREDLHLCGTLRRGMQAGSFSYSPLNMLNFVTLRILTFRGNLGLHLEDVLLPGSFRRKKCQ